MRAITPILYRKMQNHVKKHIVPTLAHDLQNGDNVGKDNFDYLSFEYIVCSFECLDPNTV